MSRLVTIGQGLVYYGSLHLILHLIPCPTPILYLLLLFCLILAIYTENQDRTDVLAFLVVFILSGGVYIPLTVWLPLFIVTIEYLRD